MKIIWIGHSCFKIEKDGYTLVIDPYTDDSVPGLKNISMVANEVICSHEHGDHNGRNNIKLMGGVDSPLDIRIINTYHDEVKGKKRGTNKIHIISDETCKVAHLGDLGCELEEEQKTQLSDCDVILIPVGGYYTIDGKQAAKLIMELKPRIAVPMHYRDDYYGFGFSEIETIADFTENQDSVITLNVSEIDMDKDYNAQVLVLQPDYIEK